MIQMDFTTARVTRVDKNHYLIRDEYSEVLAELTGKLMYSISESQELPCVGDWVSALYYNEGQLAIIHQVLPRRSFLRRKSSGNKSDFQIIASNIDFAFIMQSLDSNFNLRRLERFIAMAREGNVEPIILLSKSDLFSQDSIDEKINIIRSAKIDCKILSFNNQSDSGFLAVKDILIAGKTYCLLGSSGVGKTSLLNNLLGRDTFDTQTVREKDDRGRHTTTRRQLTVLSNGAFLIDTPGLRELGLMDVDSVEEIFNEISELAENCKFEDCTHTVKPGCAVLNSLKEGDLSQEKFSAYTKLKKETEFNNLSYRERRAKDKNFGRLIKTTL